MSASWQARLATWWVRRRIKPALGEMDDIARVRRVFDTPTAPPPGARFTPAVVGGVAGEWVEAAAGGTAAATLLFVHGGGFVGCSARTHRALTGALALQGLRLFVPDYRLAPEHPFPAAVGDVRAVWQALRTATPGRLAVAGDSAGGNLALGLMLTLRDAGEALPDAAALFSPALDLTGGSASMHDNAGRDAMFTGERLQRLLPHYLAGADPAQPLASPLLGDLHGLPPLLVHVGDDEVLRDDSLRLAEKARAAGVTVQLRLWPGVFHDWQLAWRLPEARRSVRLAADFLKNATRAATIEQFDVVVVGAGLSGIGTAVQLQRRCPELDYAVLEARAASGGTWDLFRYPGVRSDSDMYTLGYGFKPWTGERAIADGETIRRYLVEAAEERGIDRRIRHRHRVVAASWSSSAARWTLEVEVNDEHGIRRQRLGCRMLAFCGGYYSHEHGHRPVLPGEAAYRGTFVHPQHWPRDLEVAGRRVLVIGSGATAVTLVPALARAGAQVTMLQRTPGYVVALPSRDLVARCLGWLPPRLSYPAVRAKNMLLALLFYELARRRPRQVRERLVTMARRGLGTAADAAVHFTPDYAPWDQRVCVVPDADLLRAIRGGRAEVVTDAIETFTADGVRLHSGRTIAADIVVTATGLRLTALGGIPFDLDGTPYPVAGAMAYKGLMLADLPNLVFTFGYTNASWTLRSDLVARWLCRLLRLMQRRGAAVAVVPRDPTVPAAPLLDLDAGYVKRAADRLPVRGTRGPWRLRQNYLVDLWQLRFARVDDGTLQLRPAAASGPVSAPPAVRTQRGAQEQEHRPQPQRAEAEGGHPDQRVHEH